MAAQPGRNGCELRAVRLLVGGASGQEVGIGLRERMPGDRKGGGGNGNEACREGMHHGHRQLSASEGSKSKKRASAAAARLPLSRAKPDNVPGPRNDDGIGDAKMRQGG